jgi:outer membrane immunogenic protein
MKRLLLALLVALCIFGYSSTVALAGFNIGASYTDATVEESDFDADNSNYKVFAGWRFVKWFGVEAQYVNFGEFDDSLGGSDVEIDATSLDVYAIGSLRFWRLDLFAKAGLSFWDAELDNGSISDDDDGSDFAYGAGVALRITKRIWARGEWEVYEFDDVDTDMWSLGVDFRFWKN